MLHHNRSIRRLTQAVSFAGPGAGYVVYKLTAFGQEGRFVAAALRMVSGAATTCAIRIFEGHYDAATVNPAAVPDEDVILDLPAAAIAISATTASINENLALTLAGAFYGRHDTKRYAGDTLSRDEEALFVSFTFDAACVARALLRADNVA